MEQQQIFVQDLVFPILKHIWSLFNLYEQEGKQLPIHQRYEFNFILFHSIKFLNLYNLFFSHHELVIKIIFFFFIQVFSFLIFNINRLIVYYANILFQSLWFFFPIISQSTRFLVNTYEFVIHGCKVLGSFFSMCNQV